MYSKLVFFILIFVSILTFSGCKEEKFGFVNLSTWKNIDIHIDGKFKAIAGEGATKIKLTEGKHLIKVTGDSVDGEWHYEIEKEIFVGADVETNISLIPLQYPSKKRLQRIEDEKNKQLAEANKYGCKTIDEFKDYKFFNKKIVQLESEVNEIKKLNKALKKDSGYMVKNDYIDLVSFSIKDRELTIDIKNKTKYKISYFWSWFYITDEKLNILSSFKEYKEYIEIKPLSTKHFTIRLSSSTYRDILKVQKKYLFMNVDSLRYYDNIGKVRKDLKNYSIRNDIEKASYDNFENSSSSLMEYKNKLSKICK